MPAEIVPATFCADYWGIFHVGGSQGETWVVSMNGGEGVAHCSCPAYQYSKEQPAHCKHIDRVFRNGCFWNPQWHEGGPIKLRPVAYNRAPEEQLEPCPHCGGPTIGVRIAV